MVQIIVRKSEEEKFTFEIGRTALISELQKMITKEEGTEADMQRLFFRGKELEPEKNLFDYKLNHLDNVQLVIRKMKKEDIESEEEEEEVKRDPKEIEKEDKEIKKNATVAKKSGDNIVCSAKRENLSTRSDWTSNINFRWEQVWRISSTTINSIEEDDEWTLSVKWDALPDTPGRCRVLVMKEDRDPNNARFELVNDNEPEVSSNTFKFALPTSICSDTKTIFIAIGRRSNEDDIPCMVCGIDENPEQTILCDNCDKPYHCYCLKPPKKISDFGADDNWYCIDCFAPTETKTKKKKVAPSETSTRKWGGGMACAGRTKECTIVPKSHFGKIPGIPVGSWYQFRIDASEAGVHRPPVGGIAGSAKVGSQSIALSGGYEDDQDKGETFIYTGSGGRDLSGNKRSAEQSKDQELTRFNAALAMNCVGKKPSCKSCTMEQICKKCKDNWREGLPVRVLRSYPKKKKHCGKYSPKEGFRYDGIYKVVDFWCEPGQSGFKIWRYLLRRDDDEPAPWTPEGKENAERLFREGKALLEKKSDESASDDAMEEDDQGKKKRKKASEKTPPSKKAKVTFPTKEQTGLVKKDKLNERIWKQILDSVKEGKFKNEGEFLEQIQTDFSCAVCLDVCNEPITAPCAHNLCKKCYHYASTSNENRCPTCRGEFTLKSTDPNIVNIALYNALKSFFPS